MASIKVPEIYPFVSLIAQPEVFARQPFTGGRPKGVVVHYTADRDLARAMRSLAAHKLAYHLIVERDGRIVQNCHLTKSCWHAGEAKWKGMSPNREFLSVCLVTWGKLNQDAGRFLTWSGVEIDPSEVHMRQGNTMAPREPQPWDACTPKQEAALMELLNWAVTTMAISPENVCGHDECATPAGRKSDPGGVLSMTMNEVRDRLRQKNIYA